MAISRSRKSSAVATVASPKKAAVIAAPVTIAPTSPAPARSIPSSPPPAPAPRVITHEQIERRAYDLYVARGYTPGDPVADWYEAQRQLRAEL